MAGLVMTIFMRLWLGIFSGVGVIRGFGKRFGRRRRLPREWGGMRAWVGPWRLRHARAQRAAPIRMEIDWRRRWTWRVRRHLRKRAQQATPLRTFRRCMLKEV